MERNELSQEWRNTSGELLSVLSAMNETELNRLPFKGSWTPAQVGMHLYLSYGLSMKLLHGPNTPAGRNAAARINMIRNDFLNYTVKFETAGQIRPANNFYDKNKLLNDLSTTIDEISSVLINEDLELLCTAFAIPVYGQLTKLEVLCLVLFHTQRHLQQVRNIIGFLYKDKYGSILRN
jgi:hypothetical protein